MTINSISSSQENLKTLEGNTTEQLISRLATEYEKAENIAKKVEEYRDEAGLPAINELRYAGHHALLFLAERSSEKPDDRDQLVSAINHCRRAAYEAGEAGILAALTDITHFKQDYSAFGITDVVPNWLKILTRCDEIKDGIADARKTGDNRDPDHELYSEYFTELRTYSRELKIAREEMAKKVASKATETRNFILQVILGLLGLVLAIVFGLLPYFLPK